MDKTANGAALRLSDVSKTFGAVAAVRGVSESFAGGEYFCILGPSGCGKTTLLRVVAGLEAPSGGEVILGTRTITGVAPERRDVNMVFQSYALFPHMTVADNVSFGLRMRGTARDEIGRRVGEILTLVDLAPAGRRYPRELSGGQQQRVALARALINRPQVLLLDEPLSALDRNLRLAMQDELRRIQREIGITFLHVTHDQSEGLSMSDRVAVMQEGRFVQVGAPRDVYRAPTNRFVAEFLGSSNILAVTVDRSRPGRVVHRDGWSLRVEAAADGRTGAVSALIRPECIELSTGHPAGRENVFEGTVLAVTHLGSIVECRVRAGALELDAHVLSRQLDVGLTVGARVYLAIAPADVFLLPDP